MVLDWCSGALLECAIACRSLRILRRICPDFKNATTLSCCCRSLRLAFSAWQEAADHQQQKQLKLAKAAAFFQNAVLASAWNAWQQIMAEKHLLQDKLAKAVGYLQHKLG